MEGVPSTGTVVNHVEQHEQALGREPVVSHIASLEFFWLHVANVLLGIATCAALIAVTWAVAKDLGLRRDPRAH